MDEFGANTKMARLVVRAKRGERCRVHVQHGHWKTTTVVAAMSEDGIIGHKILDGPMTGEKFLDWIGELVKELREGDIVICDNLPGPQGRQRREKPAGEGWSNSSLSLDLNPIEKAISQIKSHLRKVAARDKEDLDGAIKEAVKAVKSEHAINFIKSSGYRTGSN